MMDGVVEGGGGTGLFGAGANVGETFGMIVHSLLVDRVYPCEHLLQTPETIPIQF